MTTGRPGFREWVDKQLAPNWQLLPLTHVTSGIRAEDILRAGQIKPTQDSILGGHSAYFFYGRAAYRISQESCIKVEAACPFCFIFESSIISKSSSIHAFDTGAFAKRLYKHILLDDMAIDDFSLGTDSSRPNKLIARVFDSKEAYFDGDTSKTSELETTTEPFEFHARSYLDLIKSRGRNEPDDRICTIEVTIGEPIALMGNLKAVIVPHTLWDKKSRAPWLTQIADSGTKILPYAFIPNRHPEYYHTVMEDVVRSLFSEWGIYEKAR